jgi:hypothetical protein
LRTAGLSIEHIGPAAALTIARGLHPTLRVLSQRREHRRMAFVG